MKSTFPVSLKKYLLFSMMIALVAFSTSCKKDSTPPAPAAKNIVQVAQSDTTFSILVAAVIKADLVSALSAPNANLTVFAPTNNAFRALGYASVAAINSVTAPADIAKLKSVLLYHVLGTKVPSSAITGTNMGVATLEGDSVYATRNTGGVFINAVKVITADVAASNGVIHVIGKVLIPPTGTILATAVALGGDTSPGGFSLLVAAVTRADMSSAGNPISTALASTGPFTVFAPTNQAFIDAGFPTASAIMAAPSETIAKILLYHVIPARVFSSDLVNNTNAPTALGGTNTLAITLPPAKVKGQGNTAASNIIVTDIVAKNGVIHAIDKVLLPL